MNELVKHLYFEMEKGSEISLPYALFLLNQGECVLRQERKSVRCSRYEMIFLSEKIESSEKMG